MSKELNLNFDYENKLKILVRHFENDLDAKTMIICAFNFCRRCHAGQYRKSGEAYDTHPIEVALELEKMGADYETICAALLHDTIEDVEGVTKEKLEKLFTPDIAILVDGVTKASLKESTDKRTQDIKTINKLIHSLETDPRIFIIKLADRIHNMKTIEGHPSIEKRIRIAQQTLDVYVPIARLLGMYNVKERLERQCFPIIYPKKHERINKLKDKQILKNKELYQLIYDLKYEPSPRSLYRLFKDYGIDVYDIEFKFKDSYGIYQKLKNNDNSLGLIKDLITYKIITQSVADIYKVVGVLNEIFPVINSPEYAIKDYVSNPKYNYYRAVHTYNIVSDGKANYQFHFQIQTRAMYKESVDGIASFYNYDTDDSAKRQMKRSLENDFPFFEDLIKLNYRYDHHEYNDNEFYEKVKKLILPRRINIKLGDYSHVQTYLGCTIKDLIIKLHPNCIDPSISYYVNGKLKTVDYVFKDNDLFEEKVHKNGKDYQEKSRTRKK